MFERNFHRIKAALFLYFHISFQPLNEQLRFRSKIDNLSETGSFRNFRQNQFIVSFLFQSVKYFMEKLENTLFTQFVKDIADTRFVAVAAVSMFRKQYFHRFGNIQYIRRRNKIRQFEPGCRFGAQSSAKKNPEPFYS